MPIIETAEPLGYSIKGAAQALDCSERTIYNLIYAGKLRRKKLGSRNVIPASDLRALVEAE